MKVKMLLMKMMTRGCLAVVVFLSALTWFGCSKDSDSGAAPKAFGDNTPPNPQPAGQFAAVRDDEAAVNKANACPSVTQKIDDRLTAGQEIEYEDKWSAEEGGYGGAGHVRDVIESVDRKNNVVTRTTHVNSSQGAMWFKQVCTYNFSESSVHCDMNESSQDGSGGPDIEEGTSHMKYCYIRSGDWSKATMKNEVGKYTFASGRTVDAFRMVRHYEGDIHCGSKDEIVGQGTSDEVLISSHAVPEFEGFFCGQATPIFRYTVVKDKKGNVVSVSKREIIRATP